MTMDTYCLRLPSGYNLLLRDYYFVSAASKNFISILSLSQDNYAFNFNKDYCIIYFKNKMIRRDFLIDNLYQLYVNVSVNVSEQIVNAMGYKINR